MIYSGGGTRQQKGAAIRHDTFANPLAHPNASIFDMYIVPNTNNTLDQHCYVS